MRARPARPRADTPTSLQIDLYKRPGLFVKPFACLARSAIAHEWFSTRLSPAYSARRFCQTRLYSLPVHCNQSPYSLVHCRRDPQLSRENPITSHIMTVSRDDKHIAAFGMLPKSNLHSLDSKSLNQLVYRSRIIGKFLVCGFHTVVFRRFNTGNSKRSPPSTSSLAKVISSCLLCSLSSAAPSEPAGILSIKIF